MGFLGSAARAYMSHRLARGPRRRPRGYGNYGGYGSRYGRRRRAPRRSGFGFRGPFPTYSRQTRRGSRVNVTGCCLPIPLTMGVGSLLTVRQVLRRR